MKPTMRTGQYCLALFIVACLLLNFPLLALFSAEQMLWGTPLLYIYIFFIWALLIALMALVIEF